jgi:hypothetical protein
MYLEILLTLNLIVTITIPTLLILWWVRKGRKIYKQISDLQKGKGIPSNIIDPSEVTKILEKFSFLNKK